MVTSENCILHLQFQIPEGRKHALHATIDPQWDDIRAITHSVFLKPIGNQWLHSLVRDLLIDLRKLKTIPLRGSTKRHTHTHTQASTHMHTRTHSNLIPNNTFKGVTPKWKALPFVLLSLQCLYIWVDNQLFMNSTTDTTTATTTPPPPLRGFRRSDSRRL